MLLWPLCSPVPQSVRPRAIPRDGSTPGDALQAGPWAQEFSCPAASQLPVQEGSCPEGFAISSVGSCCQCSRYPGQVCAEQMAEPWKSIHDISAQICWLSRLFTELGIAPGANPDVFYPKKPLERGETSPVWLRGTGELWGRTGQSLGSGLRPQCWDSESYKCREASQGFTHCVSIHTHLYRYL